MKKFILILSFVTALCAATTDEEKNRVYGNVKSDLLAVAKTDFKAINDLSLLMKDVEAAFEATSPKRSRLLTSPRKSVTHDALRVLKKGKRAKINRNDGVCNANLQACKDNSVVVQDDLEQCERTLENAENEQNLLYIQVADRCRVTRSTVGGRTSYKIIGAVDSDTFQFTDRPYTFESLNPTTGFVADFSKTFESALPNVGLTFENLATQNFETPIVVQFNNPKFSPNGELSYDIEQSDSQSDVVALDDLFDGTTGDEVQYKDCSYFIDSVSVQCIVCGTLASLLIGSSSFGSCAALCSATACSACAPFGSCFNPVCLSIAATSCTGICTTIIALGATATTAVVCDLVGLC